MDGAKVFLITVTDTPLSLPDSEYAARSSYEVMTSRRMREGRSEPSVGRPTGEPPSVQILVVVAITQV